MQSSREAVFSERDKAHKLTAAVTTCTGSILDQVSQESSKDREELSKPLPS